MSCSWTINSGCGELMGAGDYTRRAAFFDTLGVSPRWQSDESILRLSEGHEVAELQQVFEEAGFALTGRQARQRLYERLTKTEAEGVARGPLLVTEKGHRMRRVDVRELTPEDIAATFDDLAEFNDDHAMKVMRALEARSGLRRGGVASQPHGDHEDDRQGAPRERPPWLLRRRSARLA